MPRYQDENLTGNLALLGAIETIAETKRCAPAAVAIAWTLARGRDIVPIPGTKRLTYLEQNVIADRIELGADDMAGARARLSARCRAGRALAGGAAEAHGL